MPGADQAKPPEDVERAEQQIVDQAKRIDFFVTEYSIEMLAKKMRDGEIVVPEYQRAFTWEDGRKSRFIESVLMGLPIPFLFFWERPDGRLEVVDGSQRLRTLTQFIYDGLRLDELDSLGLLSTFAYDDLPESRQRKFGNRSIRGIILNEHADSAARLDMFERINTGSKAANPTEVRRGALAGPFMDIVKTLSGDQLLQRLAPMSQKSQDERGYDELVTRFFAYGDGLEDYHDRPSDFMHDYVERMNEVVTQDPDLADRYSTRFSDMLSFVDRHFPAGFRRTPSGQFTPRVRFEAIAVGVDAALRQRPDLAEKTGLSVDGWIDSDDFRNVTGSDGANAVARLRARIDFVRSRLLSS